MSAEIDLGGWIAIATILMGAWIFGVWCGRKAERAKREAKERGDE